MNDGDFFDEEEEDDDMEVKSTRNEIEETILIGDLMTELNDPSGEKTKREMLAVLMQ